MRKTASMLGMAAAVTAVVGYGVYSYLKRRKQIQVDEIINDMVSQHSSAIFSSLDGY